MHGGMGVGVAEIVYSHWVMKTVFLLDICLEVQCFLEFENHVFFFQVSILELVRIEAQNTDPSPAPVCPLVTASGHNSRCLTYKAILASPDYQQGISYIHIHIVRHTLSGGGIHRLHNNSILIKYGDQVHYTDPFTLQ